MDFDLLLALALFALASSITPGPNNLMLMASGANFGFQRTLPHMLGISIGHAAMVFLVGIGVAAAFAAWPPMLIGLKVASVLYMLWLAWRVATAAAPGAGRARGRPFSFLQAAAFQWVNPKAWAMALTAVTVYAPGQGPMPMLAVAIVFASVNLPSVAVWAWLGLQLQRFVARPPRLRAFNYTMAALLVVSLWPVLSL